MTTKTKDNLLVKTAYILSALFIITLVVSIGFLTKNTQEGITQAIESQFARSQGYLVKQGAMVFELEIEKIRQQLEILAQDPIIKSGDSGQCSERLKDYYSELDLKIGNIGRVNNEGIVYCGVLDSIIGVDANQYQYISQILNDPNHALVLSRVIDFKYQDHSRYLVAIHVPVYDDDGNFTGTVGGAIYLDELFENFLKKISFTEESYFIIADDNGDILYHPNSNLIGHNISEELFQETSLRSPGLPELFNDSISGKTGNQRYHLEEAEWKLGSYTAIDIFSGRKWIIILTSSIDEEEKLIQPLLSSLDMQVSLVIVVFVILFSILIFALIAGNKKLKERVTLQTQELTRAAIKIYNSKMNLEMNSKKIIKTNLELEKQRKAILNILEDADDARQLADYERDKVETVLQSIGDGVFVVDQDRKLIVFNKISEQLSGYSAQEVMGKRYDQVLKFIYEDKKETNDKFVEEALRTGEIKTMSNHTILVKKDGTHVPVADSAAPVKNGDGKIIGCVVVFRDVTKEREIDKMKTEFISVAAHQLRTPLGSMRWYMEMIMAGDIGVVSEEVKKALGQIYESNQQMLDLVNDLLDVSKIDQGRVIDKPELSNVLDVIYTVLMELRPIIETKKITLSLTPKNNEKVPKIMVDPKKLYEVVGNLISNAIKYNQIEGKVDIILRQIDGFLEISVADTGMGIPQQEQARLFGKFFRAENAVKGETEGSGLGLFVVKSYVESWGGQVKFTSKEGEGSTFTVTIPIRATYNTLNQNKR